MSKARIAELRRAADRAVDAIDAQEIPDDGAVLTKRDEARAAAVTVRTLAREPISIGVVGEFSAGKSLLIGTLLGKPDLLPVAGQPVTGNITALRLLPGAGSTTETDHTVTVEYLSRERLVKATNHMVKRLREAAANVPDLDTGPIEELDAAQGDFFRRLETWCRTLWGHGDSRERNPEVLHAAWELMRLSAAVRYADSVIGQQVEIDTEHAEAVLELGDRPHIPEQFPSPKGRPVDRRSIKSSREDLRLTFPLIHRVVYRVEVPPQVWDLSALRDENEVMLLDFPGLNSDASHNRDEYLSTSELENVSTIMIVVKGNNPGAKGPNRFYGMMQAPGRDRAALAKAILVAGNRFDEVPAPRVPDAAPVDIDSVTALSEDLRGFRTTVRDLTDDPVQRCQVVSAIGGMAHYQLRYVRGTDETRDKITDAMAEASANVDAWAKLGHRIEQNQPGDPWAAQLRSLGADGGIAALRVLIEDHARDHGLGLKTEVLERHFRDMKSAMERFGRAVDPPGGEWAAGRADAERLSTFLRSASTTLTEAREHVSVFTAAEQLRVDDTATDLAAGGLPLLTALAAEAVRRVYLWPEWKNILVRADQFVVPRRSRNAGAPLLIFADDELGMLDDADTNTTRDLYQQFQNVVTDVSATARRAVKHAVQQWVAARNDERAQLYESYADPALRDLLERALEVMESDDRARRARLLALDYALDLGTLAPELANLIDTLTPASDTTDRFPTMVPHLLPWHPDAPADNDQFADEFVRHQQQVFRMRRAIANAAAQVVTEHARLALTQVATATTRHIDRVQARLPDADRVPPVVGGAADTEPDHPHGPVRTLLAEWSARQ